MTADDKGGLAAKLREAVDTITHTHVGWKAESDAWRAVREVIAALEAKDIEGAKLPTKKWANDLRAATAYPFDPKIKMSMKKRVDSALNGVATIAQEIQEFPTTEPEAKDIELEGLKAKVEAIKDNQDAILPEGSTLFDDDEKIVVNIAVDAVLKLIAAATATGKPSPEMKV